MGQREPTARADGPCTQEEGQMLTVVRDSGRAKENRDEAHVVPTGRAKVRSRIIASVARARGAWKAPGPAGSLHAGGVRGSDEPAGGGGEGGPRSGEDAVRVWVSERACKWVERSSVSVWASGQCVKQTSG